jgi:hypothetical protein
LATKQKGTVAGVMALMKMMVMVMVMVMTTRRNLVDPPDPVVYSSLIVLLPRGGRSGAVAIAITSISPHSPLSTLKTSARDR